MKIKTTFPVRFIPLLLLFIPLGAFAQNVQVDVNLNMVHSVDGISDFGRDRHITVHSASTDRDWDGQEDKLDYFINDLDVYWGRDNGSASWKFSDTPEDPNRPNKPDVMAMKTKAESLKSWYESKLNAQQYEGKGFMIMGTNPHPTYPTLDWGERGKTWHGWQPLEVETSAEWVTEYLDLYFAKSNGDKGEPLPDYWEVINEPDMEMMVGGKSWIYATSQEKLWEYHNLVAEGVKNRLGAKAPKIGGMTWGMHDFYWKDGINRVADNQYEKWFSDDLMPYLQEMTASTVNDNRTDDWYQWDVMWQGFIDNCGDNMDFYGIHIYDWSVGETGKGVVRTGGHVEAMLDMLEWYDIEKFGYKKDIVLSEFGAVSGWINDQEMERKAWENLRPFNGMFMQFLERPSHVVYSMPFAPVKAEWGDVRDANGNVTTRYGSVLMDRVDPNCTAYDASCEWVWSDFVKWYELWRDVDGTRIDTKATDRDIQVDAYVDQNKVYLIVNNLQFDEATVDLNLFDTKATKVQSVEKRYMYFDENIGTTGGVALDETLLKTAPGTLTISGGGTVILVYHLENNLELDQTSVEEKYMGLALNQGTTSIGGLLFRKEVPGRTPMTTNINNVVVPSKGEATLRFSGKFPENALVPAYITVNGNNLDYDTDWRGEYKDSRNFWFGTMEVDVPVEYLQENNEVVIEIRGNKVTYTTVSLQVFDMSTTPVRSSDISSLIALNDLSLLDGTFDLMNGKSKALEVTFVPENATNKKISWTSSDESSVSVDEFGVVTAHADAGEVTITATSDDGGIVKSIVVQAIPYQSTPITEVMIDQGDTFESEVLITTPLTLTVLPEEAANYDVVWSSSNESAVTVDHVTGKISGLKIGEKSTVKATVVDTENGGTIFTTETEVTVVISGDEKVYCFDYSDALVGEDSYTFNLSVNALAGRTLKAELLKGGVVLGSSEELTKSNGEQFISTTIDLDNLAAIGSDYTLRLTLLDGNSSLSTCESALSIEGPIVPLSIEVKEWLRTVQVGEQIPIEVNITPENAYDKSLTWEIISGADVISIQDGIITGNKAGVAEVKGISNGNNEVVTEIITITCQDEAPLVAPSSILLSKRTAVFPNSSLPMKVLGFEPEWANATELEWSASNNLVSVDGNGLVVAGSEEGKVTVTATSVTDPNVTASLEISVGKVIYVEAEDFDDKFGDELGIYEPSAGVKGINAVKTGNYVVYQIYFPSAGDYTVTFYAGTAAADAKVEMYVDSQLQGSTSIENNGWDNFQPYQLTEKVSISSEGIHEIGVVASGSTAYQWNMEHFEMKFDGDVGCQELTSVSLESEYRISNCQSLELNYSKLPITACEPNQVVWSIDNESVATVDQSGVLVGVSVGTAVVKLTTELGEETAQVIVSEASALTSVEILPAIRMVAEGGTLQLSAEVLPLDVCNNNVTWSTSDETVATISSTGLLQALEATAGKEVTISATSMVDNSIIGTATISIKAAPEDIVIEAEDFDRTGGTFDDGNVPLGVNLAEDVGINWVNSGDYVEFDINLEPGVYSVKYLISTPSDNAEVTITLNEQSIVTPVTNNGSWDDYQELKADGSIDITTAGEYTLRIEATGTHDWQWNLDKIILMRAEMAQACEITSVAVVEQDQKIYVGQTLSLTANIESTGDCEETVMWISSNESIATVDSKGLVTAVAIGTVEITASVDNTTDKTVITIEETEEEEEEEEDVIFVTGITLSETSIELSEGMSSQLSAAIAPANATNLVFTWSSSDNSVVTVDNTGLLEAKSIGTAEVTVTTDDGGFTASVVVKVVGEVLSTSDQLKSALSIYPVPTDDYVEFSNVANGRYEFQVTDMNGKVLISEIIEYQPGFKLEVGHLPSGLYIVSIHGGDLHEYLKLQIK
ncbi:Ig-like domain-containing protein [Flammeovirga pacifica]|uniref:CBM6 domain-containing protein n=1 Tax=Flammeovirga pacifica TaxID=915059 RepID=A0A1S1Z1X3_FLAPC|nr:Ig-like domain-containing protein [Flammeovirga pacifica]OHX67105.1 hypothetical protein NH26_12510 [Flammeovirga pacifica]